MYLGQRVKVNLVTTLVSYLCYGLQKQVVSQWYSTYICKEVLQAANPADISELISDDETGLLIVRQPNFQTEHFTKAMVDLDAYLSKSRPRMQPACIWNNLAQWVIWFGRTTFSPDIYIYRLACQSIHLYYVLFKIYFFYPQPKLAANWAVIL